MSQAVIVTRLQNGWTVKLIDDSVTVGDYVAKTMDEVVHILRESAWPTTEPPPNSITGWQFSGRKS